MADTPHDETPVRKRFCKPCHLLHTIKRKPSRCLQHIFENFHLDDFREELNLWLRVALSTDRNAYEEGAAREDLQEFIRRLHCLIEALCILHMARYRETVPLETRKLLDIANRPFYLTAAEQRQPALVIRHFCSSFRHAYAKMELLDLLEAVVTYNGVQPLCKGTLVAFYQHLYYLVRMAYKHRLSFCYCRCSAAQLYEERTNDRSVGAPQLD